MQRLSENQNHFIDQRKKFLVEYFILVQRKHSPLLKNSGVRFSWKQFYEFFVIAANDCWQSRLNKLFNYDLMFENLRKFIPRNSNS